MGDVVVGMRDKFAQERCQTEKGYLFGVLTLQYVSKKGNI